MHSALDSVSLQSKVNIATLKGHGIVLQQKCRNIFSYKLTLHRNICGYRMIVKLTENYTDSIKLDFVATTPTWFRRSYKLSYRLSRFNSTTVRPASMHILIWLMLRHTFIIIENMHKTLNLFVANCARVQYTHLCVVLVFGEATSKQNIWLYTFTLEQVSVHDFQGCIILS